MPKLRIAWKACMGGRWRKGVDVVDLALFTSYPTIYDLEEIIDTCNEKSDCWLLEHLPKFANTWLHGNHPENYRILSIEEASEK